MRVTSREYKVMLAGGPFADPAAALAAVRDDLGDLAAALGGELAGGFDPGDPKERTVLFLDTPDFTLRRNGLLLRRRAKRSGKAEFTLKARTEDRYVAAAADLSPGPGLAAEVKFEEDIGPPFVARFSHSATVPGASGSPPPATLGAAATLFPGLAAVRRDGLTCPPHAPLAAVNGREVYERVYTGPVAHLAGDGDRPAAAAAEVAVILWTRGAKGRVLAAELSFRYGDAAEAYPPAVAAAARRLFDGVQRQDWAVPDGSTKTQHLYGAG